MDTRQSKQYELLQSLLSEAASELPAAITDLHTSTMLRENKFQEALIAMIELGDQHQVTEKYWWNLKKSSEILNLRDLFAPLRQKRLQASRSRAS